MDVCKVCDRQCWTWCWMWHVIFLTFKTHPEPSTYSTPERLNPQTMYKSTHLHPTFRVEHAPYPNWPISLQPNLIWACRHVDLTPLNSPNNSQDAYISTPAQADGVATSSTTVRSLGQSRYCSVRHCRNVIRDDYPFKMCILCRNCWCPKSQLSALANNLEPYPGFGR